MVFRIDRPPPEHRERLDLARSARDYIAEHFPVLLPWLDIGQPCSLGYGYFDGHCTQPDLLEPDWCSEGGHPSFLTADLPDLTAVGLQNRGIAECLVVLRAQGPRRLWFRDAYVVFTRDSDCSTAATAHRLHEALDRRQSASLVIHDWPAGWLA